MKYLSRAQERDLSKRLAAYNRRVGQLTKQKRFAGVIVPEKLDIHKEIAAVVNGRDLARLLNRVERLTNQDNLKVVTTRGGVKMTRGVREQLSLDIEAANRKSAALRQKYGSRRVTLGGKDVGDVSQVYPGRLEDIAPINQQGKNPSQKNVRKVIAKAKERSTTKYYEERVKSLRENFMQAIENGPGAFLDVDHVQQELQSMTDDEFLDMFYSEDVIDFDFIYGNEQAHTKYMEVQNAISRHKKRNTNATP